VTVSVTYPHCSWAITLAHPFDLLIGLGYSRAGGQRAGPRSRRRGAPGGYERAGCSPRFEVDRVVSNGGTISLGNRWVMAVEILADRRVSIRIEDTTLMFFDPDTHELLGTRPNPLTHDQA
jgi:hypothetical protein